MGCIEQDPYSMPNPPQGTASAPGVTRGQKVTKDMLIGDVIAAYPEAVDIMLRHGFHCIGCSVSPYEPIGAGAMSHGFSESQVDQLMEEINTTVGNLSPLSERPRQGVKLSHNAVEKLKGLMEKEGKTGMGLRISLVGGGCAGNSYELDVDTAKEADEVFDNEGLKVFYHKSYSDKLGGIQIDYRDTLQSSGFVMRNPNAKSSCGCGNSFG